jgi:hypothetical protein
MRFQSKLVDPAAVVSAFVRANHHLEGAARILQVHPTTLRAAVKRLGVDAAVRAAVLVLFGHYGPGGRLRDPREVQAALTAAAGDQREAATQLGVTEDELVASLAYHEVDGTAAVGRVAGRPARRRSVRGASKTASDDLRLLPVLGYELVAWQGWTAASTVEGKVLRREDTTRRSRAPTSTVPREQRAVGVPVRCPPAYGAEVPLIELLRATCAGEATDRDLASDVASASGELQDLTGREVVSMDSSDVFASVDSTVAVSDAHRRPAGRRAPRSKGVRRIDVESALYEEIELEALRLSMTPEAVALMAFGLARDHLT